MNQFVLLRRLACRRFSFGALLFCALSTGAHAAADLRLEISPVDMYFLAPEQRVDIDIVVYNDGPDLAEFPVVRTNEYWIAPIGEITLDPPMVGPACPLQYTDFIMPNGQVLEIASFSMPPLPAGGEYRCRVSAFAIARGRDSYRLRLGTLDIAPDASDPDFSNNVREILFVFRQATPLPGLSATGIAALGLGMLLVVWAMRRRQRW